MNERSQNPSVWPSLKRGFLAMVGVMILSVLAGVDDRFDGWVVVASMWVGLATYCGDALLRYRRMKKAAEKSPPPEPIKS